MPGTKRQLREEAAAQGARQEMRLRGAPAGEAKAPPAHRRMWETAHQGGPRVLPCPRTPAAPRAPNLGVHVGQAVPAELVEEPLTFEVVHDHGHELRVPGAGPRAARPARARASPGAGRRRRRLRLGRRRRRRGRRRLRLRVGGHGGLGWGGRGPGRAALLAGDSCTGLAARSKPTGCCYGTSGSRATPEVKGNRGKGGKGGDNSNEGPATGTARGQFQPPPSAGALARPGRVGSGGGRRALRAGPGSGVQGSRAFDSRDPQGLRADWAPARTWPGRGSETLAGFQPRWHLGLMLLLLIYGAVEIRRRSHP